MIEADGAGHVQLQELALEGELLDDDFAAGNRGVQVAVVEQAAGFRTEQTTQFLEDRQFEEPAVVQVEVDPAAIVARLGGVSAFDRDRAADASGGGPRPSLKPRVIVSNSNPERSSLP